MRRIEGGVFSYWLWFGCMWIWSYFTFRVVTAGCDPHASNLYLKIIHYWSHSLFRPVLGPTQPPIQWVPESFTGVKATGTWSYPPSSSAEVKNAWSNTSTFPICLHSLVLN